jgi:protein-disulfide isomerase
LTAAASGAGCRDSSASNAEGRPTAAAQSSSEPKDVVLPGVDTSAMTPREHHEWSTLVSELFAPCPNVPVSVATCIEERRPCGPCVMAAKWVARAIHDGASEDHVRRAYKERFDPSAVRALPLAGSPSKGPDDAPVTIVELADFECPHCRAVVPMIDGVLTAVPGKVRLVYKFVSLPMHAHAEAAARAAFAAGQQGKFWEMEHLLFERQDHLEDADLERYAQILKLDVARWKVDMNSPATKERLALDHKLEEELKLKGTPTIYVNGRDFDVEQDESLKDRVATELGALPVAPTVTSDAAATPATSASDGSAGRSPSAPSGPAGAPAH